MVCLCESFQSFFFQASHILKFAELTTITGVTQLNVTRTKQYLTTPFYGQANYPPKMNCYYELVAEPGNRILIEILDVDMEAQIFRSCLDYIGFYEGKSSLSLLVTLNSSNY